LSVDEFWSNQPKITAKPDIFLGFSLWFQIIFESGKLCSQAKPDRYDLVATFGSGSCLSIDRSSKSKAGKDWLLLAREELPGYSAKNSYPGWSKH
jgi:hypothetical protein